MYLCYQSFKSTKRTSSGNSGANNAPGKSFATEPPKKIIQALYDYRPQGPGELKFSKGDFLYVTGNENNDDWYEAYDPPSNMRGMVPVSYFEIVSRKDTIQTVPIHSAAALAATSTAKTQHCRHLLVNIFRILALLVPTTALQLDRHRHQQPIHHQLAIAMRLLHHRPVIPM